VTTAKGKLTSLSRPVSAQAKVLFNISGTMAEPVRDVTIRGLTIRDAAYTYLGTTEADR
jgi:hypothetical protein